MQNFQLPILIFTPILMALLLFSPLIENEEKNIRRSVKMFSVVHFIYTIALLAIFDFTNMGTSFDINLKILNFDWISSIGIKAGFALDSLSMLFVILTSFIFLISVFVSKNMVKKSYKLYYSLLLILQSSILGVLCSSDMFLFVFFFCLCLLPLYILLLKWGSANKLRTANRFIVYTSLGSMLVLFGFLILYLYNFINTGMLSSDIYNIDISGMNEELKYILFVFFFIGFGVELSIIPMHNWYIEASSHAVTPVSIILSSSFLQLGAYGILKFNVGIFSDVYSQIAPTIMLIAIINIIYTSICAISQKDLNKIISYLSIINVGMFLFGISSLNEIGFSGGIYQLFSHSLISAGLFSMAGIIYIKCGTKNILRLEGLSQKMPILVFVSLPVVFAAMSVPFTSGFIGNFLSLTAAFLYTSDLSLNRQIMSIIAIISLILTSVIILKFFYSIFWGELPYKYRKVRDINIHQLVILSAIVLYIIYLGIFPSVLTGIISEYSIITYDLAGVL